jgi:hypothetical protein
MHAYAHKAKKAEFIDEAKICEMLNLMEGDVQLKTSDYHTDDPAYPNNLIPFSKKHIDYLKGHPHVDPEHYLANLRTMIKIRVTK